MSAIIHHNVCPACGSASFKNVLTAIDYTVTGEQFGINECMNCTLRFTQDVPDAENMIRYYKSENYISHSNTSKGLINRLYHKIRERTMVTKRKMVEKSCGLRSGVLLDVGAGTGYFAGIMKEHGWEVTGLEPDEDARVLAGIEFGIVLSDEKKIYELPLKSFDAITLWHVLEHVNDVVLYFKLLSTLLKDDGLIFIAVPNYNSYDAAVYGEFWAAYDVPRHLYHFSPQSLALLSENSGMKIKCHKPMWYDSIYISLLSSKYKNSNLPEGKRKIKWLSAFWIGLLSNFHALMNVKKCSSVIYILSK